MSDQGETQSQPSLRERIGSAVRASLSSQEQTAEPEQAEAEVVETQQQETEEPQQLDPLPEEITPQEVAETTPDDWRTIEIDGEQLQVPPKFEKAFLQERDYTQKRQADADKARIIEAREQGVQVREQALQALQPLYAQAQLLEHEIQSFQKMDWQTLRTNDPLDYSTKRADYAALLQQRADLQKTLEQGHAYVNQEVQKSLFAQIKAAEPLIRKALPDWGPEKAQQLSKYAIDAGASAEELRYIESRAWAVPLLEKARKYDELQASKAQLPKAHQARSPVAKPGAKTTHVTAEAALYRKNQEQFRKSGGKDEGALRALIKARLRP